jgi:four helix bundle protein
MKLEELQVYQLSMELGEQIWNIVSNWNYFGKDTIGKQLVRSADSIAANLSEGFGRFFLKKKGSFVIILEAHYSKPKPGLPKLIIEN